MCLHDGWSSPRQRRDFDSGAIHVWCVALDRPASAAGWPEHVLSVEERARADRFRFERDRRHFVRARASLRQLIGAYEAVDPGGITFTTGRYGKPALSGPLDGALDFNVSHSGGVALIALSRAGAVGVDVEAIRAVDDRDALARRVFAAGEIAALTRVAPARRDEAFFAAWTRKEAFIKAIGEGLSRPLDQFEVSLVPGEPARLLHVGGDRDEAARWTMTTLPDIPGFASALAVRSPSAEVSCYRWEMVDVPAASVARLERCAV